MRDQNVGSVARNSQNDASDLPTIPPALLAQATKDFEPVWGVWANVHAFGILEDLSNANQNTEPHLT